MQRIWFIVENQSMFVYVIAGLTIIGVFAKLILQGKLHRLLKAAENMGTTKERQMRTIRNHYENSLNMDLQIYNIQAFVEKYILKLKYGGISIRVWDSAPLEMAMLCVATGGIGMIHAIHRGYGEQVIAEILIATIVSCVILLTLENLFRIETFYERMEVNIEDYLENNLKNRLGRPLIKRQERAMRKQDELVAVASEIKDRAMKQEGWVDRTKTVDSGREGSRPQEGESIPEYEIRRKATRNIQELAAGQEDAANDGAKDTVNDAANDAEVVAEVLRSFFSA